MAVLIEIDEAVRDAARMGLTGKEIVAAIRRATRLKQEEKECHDLGDYTGEMDGHRSKGAADILGGSKSRDAAPLQPKS